MTNFDVIEAYIQDFTVWKKYDGKVIVSNNKAIVKANTPFSGNWIISNNKKFEIGKIKVTGLDSNIGNNFLSYSFKATDNQIQFAGSTDGGTMKYILDDTDITKFTIQYTNTEGKGNVYLMIGNKQYDVISGQPQTYNITEQVTLDFLNTEEVTNFAGTIKFTNIL